VLLFAPAGRAEGPQPAPALPPDAAPFFAHLLPPSELTRGLDIQLRGDHAEYRFRRGAAHADIRLAHPSTCAAPDGPLCLVVLDTGGPGADALAREAAAALTSALRASATGPKWIMPIPQAADMPAGEPSVAEWSRPAAQALWILLLAGVGAAVWRSRGAVLRREALVPAGLAVLALALRFAAHPGPADVRPVLYNLWPRRAGWAALLDVVYAVFPAGDATVWNLNRVVGALSVPLLYVVARRRFRDRICAIGAAATLACTPLLVRFSASDTPYVLLCAAFLGALVAHDAYVETQSVAAWALALALMTAAMQLRPDGLWLIVPGLILTIAGGRTRLSSPAAVAAVLAFVALNIAPAAWAIQGHREAHDPTRYFVLVGSALGSPWVDRAMTPRPLAALVVLGALAVLYRRRRPEILWLLATAVAVPGWTPATGRYADLQLYWRHAFAVPMAVPAGGDAAFHQYANARYHIPAMVLACALAGVGVAALLRALRRVVRRDVPGAGVVAVGLVCLAALPRADVLQRMWTPQREFDFFRDGLARIDGGCRVATLLDVADAGFVPFEYLAAGRLVDVALVLDGPTPDGCVVYYRSGNCFTLDLVPQTDWRTFEMNPRCEAVEEKYRLEPIVEAGIPALPFRGELYARDPVPVGFYRLHARG